MSEPTGDRGSAQGPQEGTGRPLKRKVGDLVGFAFEDRITGETIRGAGVVLRTGGDNEAVQIAPLSRELIDVEPSALSSLAVDDVTAL